jgi:predicted Zn-dependent peptidase
MKSQHNKQRVLSIAIFILFFWGTTERIFSAPTDRSVRPVGKPTPKVLLPKIQKTSLKNGLNVWLVEHHELPTVAMNLVFQSGAMYDKDMPGLAALTADLLDEGTATRDALQISEELESIGANLGVSSNFDGSNVSLFALKKHLDKAMGIFADVLLHPTFPQKEFERLKNTRLTSLTQQRDQPTAIANNAFNFILYGSEYPYGNNITGNEISLNGMTRDDIQRFYDTHYRPNNATLIVVGDISLNEVAKKLESALQEWKQQPIPMENNEFEYKPVKRTLYMIDKPGAVQSEIRIGYPALARSTPDYFPVTVMNRMLGGQFASRINMNLREKHGFTYGARSSFSFLKNAGPFSAAAGVTTAKTDSSLMEFMYELNKMHDEGLTAEELSFVKKGLIGGFALGFETPAQIAGSLQSIVLYGLPENYFENYLSNIEKVTLSDVQNISQKYVDTSTMVVVVVGDLSVIKDGVLALNLGDVVYCDVDGKPIK